MIIDVTGTPLIPGDQGRLCPGNGETTDQDGDPTECCCDECDYMLACFPEYAQGNIRPAK